MKEHTKKLMSELQCEIALIKIRWLLLRYKTNILFFHCGEYPCLAISYWNVKNIFCLRITHWNTENRVLSSACDITHRAIISRILGLRKIACVALPYHF
jgi:hypothetical protein